MGCIVLSKGIWIDTVSGTLASTEQGLGAPLPFFFFFYSLGPFVNLRQRQRRYTGCVNRYTVRGECEGWSREGREFLNDKKKKKMWLDSDSDTRVVRAGG